MFNESESKQDTECFRSETVELMDTMAVNSTRDISEPTVVSRFKKVDLSCMWEWDPNAREKAEDIKQHTRAMEQIPTTNCFVTQCS
jgi:hypothetical protein